MAIVPKDEVTLAILTGGRGFRLGGIDKGSLRCAGRTLLERLMDLKALTAGVLVVGAEDDVVKGKGAPGGVVTALCQARTPWVLAVCCDMPHVSVAAAAALCAAHAAHTDVVAFEVNAGLQPFPALYRSGLGETWRARLESNPSMGSLLGSARCARVSLTEVDPTGRAVRSVNTPEDARELGVEVPV